MRKPPILMESMSLPILCGYLIDPTTMRYEIGNPGMPIRILLTHFISLLLTISKPRENVAKKVAIWSVYLAKKKWKRFRTFYNKNGGLKGGLVSQMKKPKVAMSGAMAPKSTTLAGKKVNRTISQKKKTVQ